MNVTPLDIRRKEFKRSIRGYSDEEVDLFLDEVADEFERLFQENIELQDRIRRLEEQIAGNAQLRDALEKTLVSAQLQADETRANARKESELILRDAEMKARDIVSDSYKEIQRVQQALIQLKHLEEDFRFKFRSLLEGHLKLMNEVPINMTAAEPVPADGGPVADAPAESSGVPLADDELAERPAETPFVVPETLAEVPEYPAAAPPAGLSDWTDETVVQGVPVDTAVAADSALEPLPADAVPAVASEPDTESVSEAATEADMDTQADETETLESASIFAEFDKAESARQPQELDDAPTAAQDQPLTGFFFGRSLDEVDDVFLDADSSPKGKARDFEW